MFYRKHFTLDLKGNPEPPFFTRLSPSRCLFLCMRWWAANVLIKQKTQIFCQHVWLKSSMSIPKYFLHVLLPHEILYLVQPKVFHNNLSAYFFNTAEGALLLSPSACLPCFSASSRYSHPPWQPGAMSSGSVSLPGTFEGRANPSTNHPSKDLKGYLNHCNYQLLILLIFFPHMFSNA